MEAKKAAFALLLALVVTLCFFTGRTSARHSAVNIEGGLEKAAEPYCSVCACIRTKRSKYCFCDDKGDSCREGCKICRVRYEKGKPTKVCLDPVRNDQCQSWKLSLDSTAFVAEVMLAESAATGVVLG